MRKDELTKLYLTGGMQRRAAVWRDEWRMFHTACIAEICADTGEMRRCHEYVTPPEACAADEPSILFKAATEKDGEFYACTQTEVLIFSFPDFQIKSRISLPCFNDVHHVTPLSSGTLLVADTGLDMVVEVSRSGEVLREWDALGDELWARFSRDIDYRRRSSTKPHRSHPNYVFTIDDDIWVTRFEQRDAVCLTGKGRLDIEVGKPHDGIVRRGKIYFTLVEGQVAVFDAETRKRIEVIDLNPICNPPKGYALGWCRGIEVLEDRYALVGFSRIRPTKLVENLRWLKRHAVGADTAVESLPTRVSMFDLAKRELCWEYDTEPIDLNVIFSVHVS
jgi:hypothetical protein